MVLSIEISLPQVFNSYIFYEGHTTFSEILKLCFDVHHFSQVLCWEDFLKGFSRVLKVVQWRRSPRTSLFMESSSQEKIKWYWHLHGLYVWFSLSIVILLRGSFIWVYEVYDIIEKVKKKMMKLLDANAPIPSWNSVLNHLIFH